MGCVIHPPTYDTNIFKDLYIKLIISNKKFVENPFWANFPQHNSFISSNLIHNSYINSVKLLCIKLELINELYYDARPNKSQDSHNIFNLKKIPRTRYMNILIHFKISIF